MMIPEPLPARGAPRSIQAQPPRERTVTLFATFALIATCILTGAPAATTATAPTVHPALACGGACPGLCPCPSELKDGSTTISET